MDRVLIDYAQLYYEAMLKTDLPPVISGKFVHIRNESAEYFVFSPKDFTRYHANIIERFCLDNGIEGSYDAEGKRYTIPDRAWIVSGGGKYEIDRVRKTIRCYDDSMAYGKFETRGLADKIKSFEKFKEFAVLIE